MVDLAHGRKILWLDSIDPEGRTLVFTSKHLLETLREAAKKKNLFLVDMSTKRGEVVRACPLIKAAT